MGVGQQTVDDWLGTSNTGSGKASNDARLSVSSAGKKTILEQAKKGTAQRQVAADFGISQQRVSQLVNADKKKKAKRNLTNDQRSILRGRVYNRTKKAQGGDRKSKYPSGTLIDTADTLATKHGVGRMTIIRDGIPNSRFD